MKTKLNRRQFLTRVALTTGALSTAQLVNFPNVLAAANPGNRLRIAQIGCGGRGLGAHIDWILKQGTDDLVAIVDPDEKSHGEVKRAMERRKLNASKLQVFTDYRKMFDKIGKNIDAVFIAATNHHHAPASMLAMNLGKAVYCEKPLTHDIAEARKLRVMASISKAPTQMGNQGHCKEGYRRLCELIAAGVIGKVTETHSWTDRSNGGVGPRPPAKPAPAGMDWDSWIGPAPYREFHEDLHTHEWHGWFDFGNGSLGNMSCHVLDGLYWALNVEHPTSIECEEMRGGSDERYPTGARIRWDIPARGDMPAFKAYWYEGLNKDAKGVGGGKHPAKGADRNFPALMKELQKKYPDEEFDRSDSGSFYVGDKGVIFTETYGGRMHVLPMEKHYEIDKTVPKNLPRIAHEDPMLDLVNAARAGKKETAASFDYGARLTEFSLLGNLAQHAGVGKKIEWDGPGMKVTNMPELNQWVKREPRSGWPA
jgi:predicted dehydrogenase